MMQFEYAFDKSMSVSLRHLLTTADAHLAWTKWSLLDEKQRPFFPNGKRTWITNRLAMMNNQKH